MEIKTSIINRVRGEFIEMPGLRLSLPQAERLWGLNRDECQAVIAFLIRESFLTETNSGHIIRAT